MARESSCLECARGLFGSSRALAAPCASARLLDEGASVADQALCLPPAAALRQAAVHRASRSHDAPPDDNALRVLCTVYLRCCTHTRPQCVCSESPQPSATGPSLRPPAPMAQRPITPSVMAGSVWMKRLKRAGRRPRGSRGVQRSGDVAALLHRTESREGGPPTATSLPACCPPGSPRRATSRRHCQSRRPAAAPPRRD